MSHEHNIQDGDMHFLINPTTREITNQSGKSVLIQYDHNSERYTFEMPRYIEGHDMSACVQVQVHYVNTSSGTSASTRTSNVGIYNITDLTIDPDNPEKVIGSWLITQNATSLSGTIQFQIRFVCNGLTGSIDDLFIWHTKIFSSLYVDEGINNSDEIVEMQPDILDQWYERLFEAEDSIKNNIEQYKAESYTEFESLVMAKAAETIASIPEDYTELNTEVKHIKEKIPTDENGEIIHSASRESVENLEQQVWEARVLGRMKPEFVSTLDECVDTTKIYVLPDGFIYAYRLVMVESPNYTNMVGISKDGFLTGYRMKAMSEEPVAVTGSDASTAFVSNIFLCKKGDVLRIEGVGRSENTSASAPMFMVVPVDSEGVVVTNHGFCLAQPACENNLFSAWKQAWDMVEIEDDGTLKWTFAVVNDGGNNADHLLSTPTTAVRLAGVALNGFENIIVTVNEDITYVMDEEYRWLNTGIIYNNDACEERVSILENKVTNIEEKLSYISPNYNIFDYAYIKKGELIANELTNITGTQHGHYTGVKMNGNVRKIMCKARFVPGASVVLISTKLGNTIVSNIVRGSLHLNFNIYGCGVGIFDEGTTVCRTLGNCPSTSVEGEEVSFGYMIDGNTLTVYLPNGTTQSFTDDAISEVNGEYAIWEHFTNTNEHDFICCKITKLWCESDNGDVLDDDLKRLDGAIGIAPTGQVYTQFRTGQQTNRNFE